MSVPSLPSLTVAKLPDRASVLVVGLSTAGIAGAPSAVEREYRKRLGHGLQELAESIGAKPKLGHTRTLPPIGGRPATVLVGIDEGSPDDLRHAAAAGVRQAAKQSTEAIGISVSLGVDTEEKVRAACEGALLGTYQFCRLGRQVATPPATISRLQVATPLAGRRGPAGAIAAEAGIVMAAVVAAREWVNIPPNLLYPATFAEEAQAFFEATSVAVQVLDEQELLAGGYGGILAVGGGSSRPPRLVRLSYAPKDTTRHLALVGKGITFDSGGLNLKPGDSMYTMKCDMAGAAAVLGAIRAIAELELPVQVTGYAALAENLPSATSYRPSDVLTMRGGKTVENGNTDAEGRLVMADAIARASEDTPELIVDIATLTGAAIVALGDRTAGLMASDDATADKLLDAAETAEEDVWQLPIPAHIRGKLDSQVADLRSTAGGDRAGGALVAAAFLREFVGEDISWAHLDIAGPAWNGGSGHGYIAPGGTGFGVRTLVELARSMAEPAT